MQDIKSRAIGLDRNSDLGEELPTLIIRDLTKEELEELRKRDDADELDDLGSLDAERPPDDSDDIVVLGGEPEVSVQPAETEERPEERTDVERAKCSDDIIVEGGELDITAEGVDERSEAHADPAKAEAERRLGGRLVRGASF